MHMRTQDFSSNVQLLLHALYSVRVKFCLLLFCLLVPGAKFTIRKIKKIKLHSYVAI